MADAAERFRKKLEELCALGRRNSMRLTVRQIQEAMKEEKLTVEQLQMIYAYLDQMAIEITDPDLGEEAASPDRRKRSLEVYLEELDRFPPLPEEREKEALRCIWRSWIVFPRSRRRRSIFCSKRQQAETRRRVTH